MSSLAWKSLTPRASDTAVIWSIGIVGTALSAVPGVWLEQYTNFMVILGGVLVPIGGVLLAHYYLRPARSDEALIAEMYDGAGPFRGVSIPGVAAWTAGAIVFFVANYWSGIGGTIPALVSSVVVYLFIARVPGPRSRGFGSRLSWGGKPEPRTENREPRNEKPKTR